MKTENMNSPLRCEECSPDRKRRGQGGKDE